MIAGVLQDFEDRVAEIDHYFAMLIAAERPDAKLYFATKRTHRTKTIESDWLKTLKATSFLLLYNLVESTMKSGLTVLYDAVQSEQFDLGRVSPELQKLWIRQGYSSIDPFSASQRTYQEAAEKLIAQVLAKKPVGLKSAKLPIAGNLDADGVRKICRLHGVSESVHGAARGGFLLSTIREQRNSLAHGALSFRECGRQYTVADLEEMKNQAIIFMRSVLRNIQKCISRRTFAA